ncbi:hypothetical protein [Rhodopila sp.]|uniref:hypothetical protein n=1 Tax=Rhodopila sp. TaxID=2480087 RepID=UPI003D10AB1D
MVPATSPVTNPSVRSAIEAAVAGEPSMAPPPQSPSTLAGVWDRAAARLRCSAAQTA